MAKPQQPNARGRRRRRPAQRAAGAPKRGRRGARARRAAERREAILAAALDEFSARGFAATRLDDVARARRRRQGHDLSLLPRQGERCSRSSCARCSSPVVGAHRSTRRSPTCRSARSPSSIVDLFVREIFGTRRKDVIRLIITEGPRFPEARRVLLPRGDRARAAGDARAADARGRARRAVETTRSRAFRSCWSRRRWSRSSGTACSSASRRSMCAR